MEYKDSQDMSVWQQSMQLAEEIFNLSENLPQKEDYGLTSQLRRAVWKELNKLIASLKVSINSN